jgi:hypothetical protein
MSESVDDIAVDPWTVTPKEKAEHFGLVAAHA